MSHAFNTGQVIVHPAKIVATHSPLTEDIEAEPMLFQTDLEFAFKHGGTITNRVLHDVCLALGARDTPEVWTKLRIDTRSHMLMPRWYPCIPGWHCDFMRSSGSLQLPDPARDALVKHFMFVSGDPAPEFIEQRNVTPNIQPYYSGHANIDDGFVWHDVSEAVNVWLPETGSTRIVHPPQHIIEFDANELHRGRPYMGTKPAHWRFFLRATLFPEQPMFSNKIRKQSQIYCDLNEGW